MANEKIYIATKEEVVNIVNEAIGNAIAASY